MTATTENYTLSLHDALPISAARREADGEGHGAVGEILLGERRRCGGERGDRGRGEDPAHGDRKSTRLNSSHMSISYAVFCLKKKNVCTPVMYASRMHHTPCK